MGFRSDLEGLVAEIRRVALEKRMQETARQMDDGGGWVTPWETFEDIFGDDPPRRLSPEEFAAWLDERLDRFWAFADGDLYVAGYIYLSAAAYHYQAASRMVYDTTLPYEATAFGGWFSRTRHRWRELCNILQADILTPTKNYLLDASDAMTQAAVAYAERDAENAAAFQRLLDEGLGPDGLIVDTVAEIEERTPTMNDIPATPPHYQP